MSKRVRLMYENFNEVDMLKKDFENINIELQQSELVQEEIIDSFKMIKGFLAGDIMSEVKRLAEQNKDTSFESQSYG